MCTCTRPLSCTWLKSFADQSQRLRNFSLLVAGEVLRHDRQHWFRAKRGNLSALFIFSGAVSQGGEVKGFLSTSSEADFISCSEKKEVQRTHSHTFLSAHTIRLSSRECFIQEPFSSSRDAYASLAGWAGQNASFLLASRPTALAPTHPTFSVYL